MIKPNIACCYYPTTVVFIDDNQSFLDNVLLGLDANISTRSFIEPAEAIEYLQGHMLASFAKKYLRSLRGSENSDEFDFSNVEHGYVDVDVFSIHKEIYNPSRFATTIVVVVDYTMPEMNGLELCSVLKGYPFKFVLITGDATTEKAVEAFNEGLIHQFIPKSSNDFINKLQTIICSLQKQQFEEFSDVVIENLSAGNSIGLNDLLLVKFIKDFFEQNNIVEYYLLNESGCFLMANSNGDLSCLVIKSEDEMTEYANAAIDNYGKEKIIRELQSREKVLFICTEKEHISTTVNSWGKCLYPATKIIGKDNTYYYSHIKKIEDDCCVFPNKIISYKMFLAGKG